MNFIDFLRNTMYSFRKYATRLVANATCVMVVHGFPIARATTWININ